MASSASSVKKQLAVEGNLLRAYTKWQMQAAIAAEAEEDGSHSDGKVHPSSLSGCPTKAVFTSLGFPNPRPVDVRGLRIFGLGTAIHRLLQAELHSASLLSTVKDKLQDEPLPLVEVPISHKEYDIVGHVDGIVDKCVYGDRAVLEIKSINSNSISGLREPKEEHKIQGCAYLLCLHESKEFQDVKGVVFVYYSKNDSVLVEFFYEPSQGKMKEVENRALLVREMIATGKCGDALPAPHYQDPAIMPCKFCQFCSVCFGTFDREDYSKKALPLIKERWKHEAPKEKPAKENISGKRSIPKRR